jgi:pimeloyl-ACP methyl ester carboxylesterase
MSGKLTANLATPTLLVLSFLAIQGHRIEYECIDGTHPRDPVMVFLHEGLGSVAMWKDFPSECAREAGCGALVYSRYGYGRSDPLVQPRAVNYMHDEALRTLPELLDKLGVQQPILFGHSDGASIALIHAGGSQSPVRGVILMAPHTMVEDIALQGIEAAKRSYESTGLRDKLARYHSDPDSAFRGWSDIWLNRDFRGWNIDEYSPRITCPILAIQGERDHYGTMEHIERIARAAPHVEVLTLNDCGHSAHRDQPAAVIERVTQFVKRITDR